MKFFLPITLFCSLLCIQKANAQAWKSFNIISDYPNATDNEIRFLNNTIGCLGSTIAIIKGILSGNSNLLFALSISRNRQNQNNIGRRNVLLLLLPSSVKYNTLFTTLLKDLNVAFLKKPIWLPT